MAEAQETSRPISKKHLLVRDGLFKAELDEFFKRELAEDGYSGVIVRKSKTCEVIIIATRPSQVLGEKTRRIRELTAIVNKRFGHEQGQIDLYRKKNQNEKKNHSFFAVPETPKKRNVQAFGCPTNPKRCPKGIIV